MTKLTVQDTVINLINVNGNDYICLTDMLRAKDGDFFITDWLRNRNTLEYIGIWENVYNPNFNYGEFATIKIRIEYLFPNAKVFQSVPVTKPVRDEEITILGFQHIGNTDVVFGIDLPCPDFNAFYEQCSLSFHAIAPSKSATIASIALRSSSSRFTISAIFLLSA